MKPQKKIIYILLFCLPLNIWAYQKPHIININQDVYKAANKNWSVAQDERGVMYFGNDIGLLESDGMDWLLYRIPNSSLVRSIAVESHETIFTGGFQEIGRWDRDITGTLKYTSLTYLLKENNLQNESIWKVWIAPNRVYFQSFSSIYVYDYHTVEAIRIPNGFLFLLKVRDEYWVQEIHGSLYRLKENKLHKVAGSEFFNGTTVRVILPYGKDGYLIGISSGEIYLYDGSKFSLWNEKLSAQLRGQELNNGLYSVKRSMYYLGTQLNGMYEVNPEGEVTDHFSTTNSLQNNTVLSLYEDNLNNIWVAMDRGLAYIRYTNGLSYFRATERDAGAVYDAKLWKGNIFIGTNQGVYYVPQEKLNEQGLFSSLRLINGTQGQVWTFAEMDERLFCCHNSGLLEITPNLTVADTYKLNTGVFRVIEANVQGVDLLLVVTYNNLVVIKKGTNNVLKMQQISEPIINVEVDHLGNIWLETLNRGVYKCRFDTNLQAFKYYTYYGKEKDKSLPVKLKLFKSGGRLLFLGDDIFWTYNESTDKITPNDHLNECFKSIADLKKIVHIHNEYSWAIAGSSIHYFYYDGYIARVLESHNLKPDNLSLITLYENISVLNDTTSMICLDAGFILHKSGKASNETVELPVPYLESIQMSSVNESPQYIHIGKESDIPYNYNDLTIRFTVSNAFASGLLVQYLLTGVDNDWSKPTKTNKAAYDRLPTGSYNFQVRTTDGLGHYSDAVTFSFNVLPPWYHTIWAYLLYAFITMGILGLAWVMVLRRYRNIHLRKIRAREAQYLRMMNEKLIHEIEEKNAELFTQTSFIIQKNELILKLKSVIDDFCAKNTNKALLPLYQKMNTLLSNHLHSEDDWKMFLIQFEQKHQGFFKRLKTIHPQLTNSDLRLCACLKLSLDTKDIASLMNLSVRAIENSRYRLRKKMNLTPTQNLNEYLLGVD